MLSSLGLSSGLLVDLTSIASFESCGATYQHCYSVAPMIRMKSKGINDLSTLKLEYWDKLLPIHE